MTIQEELTNYRSHIEKAYSKPVRYHKLKAKKCWNLVTLLLIGGTLLINLLLMLAI